MTIGMRNGECADLSTKTTSINGFKAQAITASKAPIGMLKAQVPDDCMGDVIGDINKRRGRVLGMEPGDDGMQALAAQVPMAEMYDFSTVLRSMTQGRGSFTLEFDRYEQAPEPVAQKVIEAAQ